MVASNTLRYLRHYSNGYKGNIALIPLLTSLIRFLHSPLSSETKTGASPDVVLDYSPDAPLKIH